MFPWNYCVGERNTIYNEIYFYFIIIIYIMPVVAYWNRWKDTDQVYVRKISWFILVISECTSMETDICPSIRPFHMSRSNLKTPWPIHFKFHRVIEIAGLAVCILYGEILNFHSRVMGLYSSNCRQLFVCRAVNCPLANSIQTLHSYWNW